MRLRAGETLGRGGIVIPPHEITSDCATMSDATDFMIAMVQRNSFSPSSFGRRELNGWGGLKPEKEEEAFQETFLPATDDKPAGVIRYRHDSPLDSTRSTTKTYDFLSAPANGKAGPLGRLMIFRYVTPPLSRYPGKHERSSLYVDAGNLKMRYDSDWSTTPLPKRPPTSEDRAWAKQLGAKRRNEQKMLGKFMQQCLDFLAE